MAPPITNVVGFDDAPFARTHRGDVLLIGVVVSKTRLDGVISTRVRRDGINATDRMIALLRASQFAEHVRAVILQGIAVAGFNVIDVHHLHDTLGLPVVTVARRQPDFAAMERALSHLPGGKRKWKLIEQLGPMEPVRGVFVQRVGIDLAETKALLKVTTLHGNLPEPLRLAHLIAGGVTTGKSRGRA